MNEPTRDPHHLGFRDVAKSVLTVGVATVIITPLIVPAVSMIALAVGLGAASPSLRIKVTSNLKRRVLRILLEIEEVID